MAKPAVARSSPFGCGDCARDGSSTCAYDAKNSDVETTGCSKTAAPSLPSMLEAASAFGGFASSGSFCVPLYCDHVVLVNTVLGFEYPRPLSPLLHMVALTHFRFLCSTDSVVYAGSVFDYCISFLAAGCFFYVSSGGPTRATSGSRKHDRHLFAFNK